MNKQKKRRSRRRERDLRWLNRLEVLPKDMGDHRYKKIYGVDVRDDAGKAIPAAFWNTLLDDRTEFARIAAEKR